jgi:cysteinyl-tRNA synthetase
MTDAHIKLYNTLTREKSDFIPIDDKNVRMYVCGPTVYDFAHIGNARPVVVFDLLYRLLREKYGENHVTYARNITDVDDKIMERAVQDNISIAELTRITTEYFHQDTDAMGVLRPTYEPRATAYIDKMIELIQILIQKNHAYVVENHVLFDTESMKNYGALSNRSLEDMIMGARVEVAPYKKNPTDFVLWKPSHGDMVGWDSPFGYGRPGWHIECSAMSSDLLGNHFDIHGGGIDLTFPHHENEIAQSCCAYNTPYVNVWLHNGFLQINGQKMSKSLGNFFTIRQLLTEKNISGQIIRFLLLRTQYRQPIDWTDNAVAECTTILNKWFRKIQGFEHTPPVLCDNVRDALYDDMNMPLAITYMHALNAPELAGCLNFLGFKKPESALQNITESEILEQIGKRNQARKSKDFAQSDTIRDALLQKGVILHDSRDGTDWEYIVD